MKRKKLESFLKVIRNPSVTIEGVGNHGEVTFSVPIADLGISPNLLSKHDWMSQFELECVAEAVIVARVKLFAHEVARIKREEYGRMRAWHYTGVKASMKEDGRVRFEFHVSELRRILDREFKYLKSKMQRRKGPDHSEMLQAIPVHVLPKLPDEDQHDFAPSEVLLSNKLIKVQKPSPHGDVVFSVNAGALNITEADLKNLERLQMHLANNAGELLVRKHLDVFKELLERVPDYEPLAQSHNHVDFGMRPDPDDVKFQFHLSLLHRLINEELDQLVQEHEETREFKVKFKKPNDKDFFTLLASTIMMSLRELGVTVNLTIRSKGDEYEVAVEK